jgi:dihydrofolate synthase/folylpolyglutamate synthase
LTTQDPIGWLYGLQHFGIKLGLDNIRALLELLERPDRAYPAVLVGGTNGKGSVAAMLESMVRAHGLRSGLFTSPHLVRPNERIRLDGEDIGTSRLHASLLRTRERIVEALERGLLGVHPSFFEVITATALAVFRDAGVEAAVLEVGLGGRLDATNAVEPVVSVVVTVDYDHTDRLGTTLGLIAAEKAAIARRGRVLVSGVEHDEARTVLSRTALEKGAALVEARRVARLEPLGPDRFSLRTEERAYPDLGPALPGAHQRENARVAVVAFEALAREVGVVPDPARVREGLAAVRWPGRLQWVPGSPPLLLDGAHNPAGARALARHLGSLRPARRAALLFGATQGKDAEGILRPLQGLVERVVLTRARVERACEPEDLLGTARSLFDQVDLRREPREALVLARELAAPDGFVVVAGSLYVVGEVLGLLEGAPAPGPVSL